jgi:hypothetical protein
MTGSFEELMEVYEEECGAEIVSTRTNTCNCIEFAEDGFPTGHTLGGKALDHGFLVTSVAPENELADDGAIPVFFSRFSMKKETRTVEVEKEATVVRTKGEKHTIIGR